MTNNKKVILITGGAGRIGSALARDLSSKKHKIILGDIDINKLKKLNNFTSMINHLIHFSLKK